MGYTFNAPVEALYGTKPLESAFERIAFGMSDLLHHEIVRRTPVAKPPPGVGLLTFSASRGRAPGTLRAAWRRGDPQYLSSPTGNPRVRVDEINDDPQWAHVEYPTRPHIIKPRLDRRPASVLATGKPRLPGTDERASLAWVGAGGRTFFAREVHHPGTSGVHMTRDGLAATDVLWVEHVGVPEMERWAREQEGLVP